MSYQGLMMAGYQGFIRKCHSVKIFRCLKRAKNHSREKEALFVVDLCGERDPVES